MPEMTSSRMILCILARIINTQLCQNMLKFTEFSGSIPEAYQKLSKPTEGRKLLNQAELSLERIITASKPFNLAFNEL